MGRKINRYFVTIPVDSWQEAQQLGSETNWKILETLRDAGIEGLTVEELAKKTRAPKTTVYNVLSKLQAGEWVESRLRRFEWGRPTKELKKRFGGKPSRVYIEKVPWGSFEFNEDFMESLEPLLKKQKDKLNNLWLAFLDEIVKEYRTSEELEKFFPKDAIHEDEECGWSHEAFEFLTAVSIAMIEKLLRDAEFDAWARKNGFTK